MVMVGPLVGGGGGGGSGGGGGPTHYKPYLRA